MSSLLNSQKHYIFEELRKNKRDPEEFEKDEQHDFYKLTHKRTGLYFRIDTKEKDTVNFKWAQTQFPVYKGEVVAPTNEWKPLDYQIAVMLKWIRKHVDVMIHEEQLGDPWDKLNNFQKTAANEEFKPNEIKFIEAKLDQFPAAIKELKLDKQEEQTLIQEVKELREDLKKDKKKKWIRSTIGFLYEVAKVIVKDAEARKKIYDFFTAIVDQIHNLPTLLK